MSSTSRVSSPSHSPHAPWSLTWLAGLLPLAYYLATASAHGYFLDGGEFVAAARDLDIAHPPGQPLNAVVSAFFALLPVGPLAYRVAVASAVMCAVAIAFVFRAVFHTLIGLGNKDVRRASALSLAAAWLVASGSGFWLQAIRPEVYGLEAALAAIVLDAIVRFELSQPSDDLRPLYVAAFFEGLSLANHHLLAVLLLPAAAPTLGRVFARRGFTVLMGLTVAPIMGLATYAYLPIRAGQHPAMNLGDPSTLTRLFWVVSAQAFQKNVTGGVPLTLSERFLDVLVGYFNTMTPYAVLLCLAGMYVTSRVSHTRRFGLIWSLALVVSTASRAWFGFVRGNPDALGYMMPGFMAIAALSAVFVSTALALFDKQRASLKPVTSALAYGLCAICAVRVVSSAKAQSFADYRAPHLLDDLRWRALPPRAIVLAHDPSTIFLNYGLEAEERVRPDITLVPIPLLAYPGMVDALLAREPLLVDLLRAYVLDDVLDLAALQSLSAERPVYLELDPRIPPKMFNTLVPDGLLYRVLADGTTLGDERQAREQQERAYDGLYERLGRDIHEPQTQAALLWRHYLDALYYAALGDRDAARRSIKRGLERQPLSRELRALAHALENREATGPIDVRPFLPSL